MNSQEQIETISRRSFLHRLPKTWPVKCVLAFALLGLCFVIASAIWKGRDLVAIIAIAVLIIYGLRVVIDALPLSSKTRARMAETERLNDLYPSYRYRIFLWIGIGSLLPKIWRYYQGQSIPLSEFSVPVACIAGGLLATIIWRFRHSNNVRGA